MKKILFLCTGNSCRSVMAEALLNSLGAGRFSAVSAGSSPTGEVHPKSLETLARYNIEVKELRSKSWNEFTNTNFDLVITVCDHTAAETCPIFLGKAIKRHWSTPDPAKAEGSEAEINVVFDDVLASLKQKVEEELL